MAEKYISSPPQDAALLLQDRISPKLRKSLKQHNSVEGVGQLANHTCCNTHWNANLEVASIDHHKRQAWHLWGFCAPNTTLNKILKS